MNVLRVAQLNAGSLLEPGWAERRHEIVAWIERLDPDVVCLQEVWESDNDVNTAQWLADALAESGRSGRSGGAWHVAFGGAPFAPELWPDPALHFGRAVLSRWPIDHQAAHLLPVSDDADPLATWVPWGLLHVRTAGLDVFSTHLAAAPEWGRDRQLQVLAIDEHIKAARGDADTVVPGQRREGMPVILCGDFNAEPDSDEIRFLGGLTALEGRTTHYQDAWRVAGDGPGFTQDWRTNEIAAAMNIPRKRIDYVFVGDGFQRRGSAGRVLSAAVAFDEPLTGVSASDHAGLVVEILWPDRPST